MDAFQHLPMQWVAAVFLLSLRVGAFLVAAPLFADAGVPVRARVLIVVALSMALCVALNAGPGGPSDGDRILAAVAQSPLVLMKCAATEVALGLTMSIALHAGFAVAATAGNLLDIQIGLGMSQLFDPATSAASTVLTVTVNRLAIVGFFMMNGHHALVRAIAFSLSKVPLGASWSIATVADQLIADVALMFSLTLVL